MCSRSASIWRASISGQLARPGEHLVQVVGDLRDRYWKSPVLLVHGDDDRNVQFSQTTGLVQLLRAHNVYHELIVFTDDTHEPLIHARYLYAFNRLEEFIGRFWVPPRLALPRAGDEPFLSAIL